MDRSFYELQELETTRAPDHRTKTRADGLTQSGVEKIGADVDKPISTTLATDDCVVRSKYVELYSTRV